MPRGSFVLNPNRSSELDHRHSDSPTLRQILDGKTRLEVIGVAVIQSSRGNWHVRVRVVETPLEEKEHLVGVELNIPESFVPAKFLERLTREPYDTRPQEVLARRQMGDNTLQPAYA